MSGPEDVIRLYEVGYQGAPMLERQWLKTVHEDAVIGDGVGWWGRCRSAAAWPEMRPGSRDDPLTTAPKRMLTSEVWNGSPAPGRPT